MLAWIWSHKPTFFSVVCIALCAILPYAGHRIHRALREATDPPWKREDERRKQGSS